VDNPRGGERLGFHFAKARVNMDMSIISRVLKWSWMGARTRFSKWLSAEKLCKEDGCTLPRNCLHKGSSATANALTCLQSRSLDNGRDGESGVSSPKTRARINVMLDSDYDIHLSTAQAAAHIGCLVDEIACLEKRGTMFDLPFSRQRPNVIRRGILARIAKTLPFAGSATSRSTAPDSSRVETAQRDEQRKQRTRRLQ